MVSKVVRKTLPVLQLLANSKPKEARKILQNANRELIEAIRQCVLNVLRGIVSLSKEDIRRLDKYKSRLREIADKTTNFQTRKKIIQQGENFLIPILGALVPHIISGISSLINRKKSAK